MRRLGRTLVLALTLTTSACSGHTSIAPGDRVRVTAPILDLYKRVGTVAALETDTLVVNTGARADALDVPLAGVTELEVHRGQKSKAGTGAIIGGSIGLAVGAVLGYGLTTIVNQTSDTGGGASTALGAAAGALVVGLPGAGIGALIGLSIKVDRWETVPLDHIRVGVSPAITDAVAVSVAFRLRL